MCNGIDTNHASLFLQLDRPETKPWDAAYHTPGELSTDNQLARRFRHGGWHHNRQLIYDSLRRTRQTRSRVTNFNECGATAYVYRSVADPTKFRLGGSSCRDRFCVPCSRDRSRCLATNVINALGKRPARFLTLTLLQTAAHLRDVLDKLYDSFRKLRTTRFWKTHVRGGCAFIEVKYNADGEAWNVHLHAIIHGTYLDKFQLAREWHAITGDSYIVRVKLVEDDVAVGQYVVKYVSKPFNNTFLNRNEYLDTVIAVMVGRRLCLTFGDWRGIKLTESPNDQDWISLGTFHDIVTKAAQGDRESLAAIHDICRQDADNIIAAAQRARPPPPPPHLAHTQITFAWTEPLIREIL